MNKNTFSLDWTTNTNILSPEKEESFNYSKLMNSSSNVRSKTELGLMVITIGLICSDSEAHQQNLSVSYSTPSIESIEKVNDLIIDEEKACDSFLKTELEDEVTELSKLQDNWDGEGANRVSTTSIIHALNILNFKEAHLNKVSGIYASRNGFVSLQWEGDEGQMAGIELGRKQMSYFVTLKDKSIYQDAEYINEKNIEKFFQYLSLL